MNVYSVLQIGSFHTNYCEDFWVAEPAGNDLLLCAVLDGCTMGEESYFAATLVGKLLRKIARERHYQAFYNPSSAQTDLQAELKAILKQLFGELRLLKNQLLLAINELLTTLILLLIHEKTGSGVILVIGDGLVCIDGTLTEFEQDNKPDYLGYHLGENFEAWFGCQQQYIVFDKSTDVSLATDGIFTFQKITKDTNFPAMEAIDYLLKNTEDCERPDMLVAKLRKLERQYGLKPTDDLAVVRLRRQVSN